MPAACICPEGFYAAGSTPAGLASRPRSGAHVLPASRWEENAGSGMCSLSPVAQHVVISRHLTFRWVFFKF